MNGEKIAEREPMTRSFLRSWMSFQVLYFSPSDSLLWMTAALSWRRDSKYSTVCGVSEISGTNIRTCWF